MDTNFALEIIKMAAQENDLYVEDWDDGLFISLNRDIFYEGNIIKPYTYDGEEWLKVHMESQEKESVALYSLRSISDVVEYSQTIISRSRLRSMRRRS